ncbi:MAG: NAD-dependent epimerase/dehydratase family protein [Prevotella sp.]
MNNIDQDIPFSVKGNRHECKSVLVTGASGFIGSFIVAEAIRRGYETWAAVRRNSSRKYLQDPKIHFIELDLNNPELLTRQLSGHDFCYVIHAAGITKSTDKEKFLSVNAYGTANLAEAVMKTCSSLKRFVFLSSLSVMGPVHEKEPYIDIKSSDIAVPNTAYGRSKLVAERMLSETKGLPYIIIRPTGVYGPREKDYFMMFKSIKNHMDYVAGYRHQDITFVYVDDVVQAVFLACEKGNNGSQYAISDGQVYTSTAFSDYIRRELGNIWVIRLKAPLWFLRIVTLIGELVGRATGKISALNNDKYNILKQRNWRCDITPAINELGYTPSVTLEEGVRRTAEWYKSNKWL